MNENAKKIRPAKSIEIEPQLKEPRFRAMADASPDAIINIDKNGHILFWNSSAKEMFGYSEAEIIGKNVTLLMPERYRFPHKSAMNKFFKTGKGQYIGHTANLEAKKKDGTEFAIELTLSFWTQEGQNFVTGTIRDVDQRMKTEAALRDSKKRYQELFDGSPVALWEADFSEINKYVRGIKAKGITDFQAYFNDHPETFSKCGELVRVIDANDITLEMFGAARTEEFQDRVRSQEGLGFLENAFIALAEGKTFHESEGRALNTAGETLNVLVRMAVSSQDTSGQLRAVISMVNITSTKESAELHDVLSEINAAITSTLRFDEILEVGQGRAAAAMGCEDSLIIMRASDNYEIVFAHGRLKETRGTLIDAEKTPEVNHVFQKKASLVVNDTSKSNLTGYEVAMFREAKSLMLIPIVVGNEAIGALVFADAASGFSEAKVEFGEKLGISLSLALANARSFEATTQALSDAQGLQRISTDMTKSLDITEVLNTGLDEALGAISADHGCIYVRDEPGTLTIRSQRNLTPEFLAAKTIVAQGEGCAGEAAETQKIFAPTKETGTFICADSRELLRLDCLAAVPIIYKGNTMGVLEMFAPVFRRISERERNIAEAIAGQLAISLENASLFADQRNIADTLQGILLVLPDRISGLDFGRAYHSSTEVAKVGGDFYDLFEVDDDKVGIIIGDVSGKGLKAATLTSMVKNTVRAYIYEHDSIPKALSMTNEIVIGPTTAFDFVSLWLGVLDKRSGKLIYCNAGHPPAIIKRKTGKPFFLKATSPVVGVLAELDYIAEETHLEIGDVLILYTDGIIEARQGRRFFGDDRLINFVENLKKRDVKEIPGDIMERVFSYSGSRIADDVAILVISRTLPSK